MFVFVHDPAETVTSSHIQDSDPARIGDRVG
jgi:hypothetical protein